MFIGGLLAKIEHFQSNWIDEVLTHFILALGGGALLSAVGLTLVPDGIKYLSITGASLSFLSGGVFFMLTSQFLAKKKTAASNLIAMLADYLPESLALGASIVSNATSGMLLALLIGLQNLPEGFSSFKELREKTKISSTKVLVMLFILSLLGPIAAYIGFALLSNSPTIIGVITLFASGGILYLVFEDIAPGAKLKSTWIPPLGAVLGFLLGIIGKMFLLPTSS